MYEHKPINSPFVGLNFSVVTCSALVAPLASWAITLDSFTPFIMKLVKFPWDTHTILSSFSRALQCFKHAYPTPGATPKNSGQYGCKRPYIAITEVLSSSCFLLKPAVFIARQGKGQSHKHKAR